MKYNRKGNKQIKRKQKTETEQEKKKKEQAFPPTGPVAHLHRTPRPKLGRTPAPRAPSPAPPALLFDDIF